MDLATLLGLLGGIIIVGSAIVYGGSPIIFVNIPSILIVCFGSLFVVTMKFSFQKLKNAFSVAAKAFFFKTEDPIAVIQECIHLAAISRKKGPLGLESEVIKNKYLERGVRLYVDGTDADIIKVIMQKEKFSILERHEDGQKIFLAINEVAPAMGMIGTLIGLVQMLVSMDDPAKIGPAMAVALLTTLYGALIANLIAKPMADKLELRSTEEELVNTLCVEAVYAMAKGYNSMIVEESLVSYLSQKKRQEYEVKKEIELNQKGSAPDADKAA